MSKEKQQKQDNKQSDSEESFEDLLEASFQKEVRQLKVGDQIEAEIVSFDQENMFLDLGTRVEGVVPKVEFTGVEGLTVKEGDTVTVYVVGKRHGAFQCSKYMRFLAADGGEGSGKEIPFALVDAFERGIPVEGKVKAVIKGGFEVTVMGNKTFCPISQIEKDYCKNTDVHLDKTYTFEILECKEDGKDVVVGRRDLLAKEAQEKIDLLWQKVELDDVYEGTVTSLQPYGAFIDIGGIDGLLHISEISHERVDDARKVLTEGQKLKVAVIDLDREAKRMGLSVKIMHQDPWDQAMETLSEGREFEGKVVRIKPYGAFVELFPGVDGLVHISKLGAARRLEHPKEVLTTGDTVRVRILKIDKDEKKISLTMEEPEADYRPDLALLKKEQEKKSKKQSGTMADLLDEALKKKP
jgi:small subunit ribosomal protein S1